MFGRYIMRGLFGGIALFLKVDMDYGFYTGGGLSLMHLYQGNSKADHLP